MDDYRESVASTELASLLSGATTCCEGLSKVSILDVGDSAYDESPRDRLAGLPDKDAFERLLDTSPEESSTRLFFISGTHQEETPRDENLHVHIDIDILKILHEKAHLTARFLACLYNRDDWTVAPASLTSYNSISLHYGFWIWGQGATHSFVELVIHENAATYFCVNFPIFLEERIRTVIKSSPKGDDFLFVDFLIMDSIIASYRKGITTLRDKLRPIEKEEDTTPSVDERAKELHHLAVNWHIIVKDLADIHQIIQTLQKASASLTPDKESAISEDFKALEDTCLFWSRWAATYLERTNMRINLMHHLAAQKDNQLNQDISNLTKNIALETQKDSVSMFTIAAVTVLFLPATFVCAVSSTVFFTFDGSSFAVSPYWWTLPATAIPLTAVVAYVWFLWRRERVYRNALLLNKPSDGMQSTRSSASVSDQK